MTGNEIQQINTLIVRSGHLNDSSFKSAIEMAAKAKQLAERSDSNEILVRSLENLD
jgi:hypothetical protein